MDRIISTLPFAALATHLAPVLRAYAADDDPVIRAEIASHVCALQRRLQDEAVAVADSNSSSSLLASTVVAVLATVLGVPADVTEGDPADDGLDLPHRHAKRAWQELIQDVLSSARIITLLDNIISGAVATSTSAAVSSTSESSGDASGKWGVPSDDDDEDDADGDSATKFNVIAAAVVPPMMLRLPASSPRYSDTAVALRLLAYACPVVDRVIVVERIMPAVERFTSVEAARSDVGLALLDLIEAVIVRVGSHRDDGMEVLSKMVGGGMEVHVPYCHAHLETRVTASAY